MIVDPQIDFISGSLKVEGAKEKMDALADYILRTDGEYICKLITMDQHPYRHDNHGPASLPALLVLREWRTVADALRGEYHRRCRLSADYGRRVQYSG